MFGWSMNKPMIKDEAYRHRWMNGWKRKWKHKKLTHNAFTYWHVMQRHTLCRCAWIITNNLPKKFMNNRRCSDLRVQYSWEKGECVYVRALQFDQLWLNEWNTNKWKTSIDRRKKLSHTNNVAKIINELNFIPTCQPLPFSHIHAFSIAQTSEKRSEFVFFLQWNFCVAYMLLLYSLFTSTQHMRHIGAFEHSHCVWLSKGFRSNFNVKY